MTVCLGNICRSPAAEAVLQRRLAEAGLADEVTVSSAGTSGEHEGERPHELTLEVGQELGYAFPMRGARLGAADLEEQDVLLVMDEANRRDVLRLARTDAQRAKVRMMGEFASDVDTAGVREVPDPWGRPREQFERMYRQLEDAADGVVAAVREGRL